MISGSGFYSPPFRVEGGSGNEPREGKRQGQKGCAGPSDKGVDMKIRRSQRHPEEGAIAGQADGGTNSGQSIEKILIGDEGGYLDLVQNSENLIVTLTPGGTVYYVNPKWQSLLKYEIQEIRDLPFVELVQPSQRAFFEDTLKRVIESGEAERIRLDLMSKDGKKLSVEGEISCYYEGDEVVAVRCFFKPLSSRPVQDKLSGVPLEQIFLEFHDRECSLAEPCFDEDE